MSEFKVGDKVKVVDADGDDRELVIGREGIVQATDGCLIAVNLEEEWLFHKSELELIANDGIKDRDKTDIERKFFDAVENPKPATEELKDVYRAYGKYVRT